MSPPPAINRCKISLLMLIFFFFRPPLTIPLLSSGWNMRKRIGILIVNCYRLNLPAPAPSGPDWYRTGEFAGSGEIWEGRVLLSSHLGSSPSLTALRAAAAQVPGFCCPMCSHGPSSPVGGPMSSAPPPLTSYRL